MKNIAVIQLNIQASPHNLFDPPSFNAIGIYTPHAIGQEIIKINPLNIKALCLYHSCMIAISSFAV